MGAIFNSRVLFASAANIPETVGGHLSSLMGIAETEVSAAITKNRRIVALSIALLFESFHCKINLNIAFNYNANNHLTSSFI